ncbi:hypothetical protein GQ43DRAFT_470326 [Delitschia confertaspora ATCC 74209]|uniref:Uncharacterized protein n=1 Tax=Delitschia confertaspora ATCC 74209 TaxID=1513339 RepID=A0A9P4JRG7_9PLEO|nr:hypothetical protein GQ43DRAFT_470326 [Delitschia confertaspora ATCC 74209]
MTAPAVEARSLSSLTALASNPPSYPRNPTHVKHEPLVLYIARVPGSRDVFLTPMKPRDKVVTAEDVQSSLYYLHIDQPEDARLIEATPDVGKGNSANANRPQAPLIPRKAVPNQAPAYENPLPAPRPMSAGLPVMSPKVPDAPIRKPIESSLGPRSHVANKQNIYAGNYSQHLSANSFDPHAKHVSVDFSVQRGLEQQAPLLPPRRSLDVRQQPQMQDYSSSVPYHYPESGVDERSSRGNALNRPFPLHTERSHNDFLSSSQFAQQPDHVEARSTTLTLIRRDPASGAQWNVARIEDPPIPEVSSNMNDPTVARKRRTGAPLYIEIMNPGYSKFLNVNAPDTPFPLISRTSDLSVRSFDQPEQKTSSSENVFRRRLWMEGSKYSDRTFGHRKLNSHDSGIGVSRDASESWTKDRQDPNPFSESQFLTRDEQVHSAIQVSNRTSSFRGYVFLSPWNGRCEFSTGAGGSSLKCKHLLPAHHGASPPLPATVSELRFNLPNRTVPLSTPRGEEPKRSSFLKRPGHSRNSSTFSALTGENTEEVKNSLDRMDLTLGQEFAGGGFGGKQAKLGKLIIEDEGLKMADVLVAANLALWWRAYDKVDGRTRSGSGSLQG